MSPILNKAFDAARLMAKFDTGVLPVASHDRLVGIITDRDITIRATARGNGPEATIRDVMTPRVKYCYEHEDIEHVARNMADLQVRRLPVVNREQRLVGIISLADIALSQKPEVAGEAVSGISQETP